MVAVPSAGPAVTDVNTDTAARIATNRIVSIDYIDVWLEVQRIGHGDIDWCLQVHYVHGGSLSLYSLESADFSV